MSKKIILGILGTVIVAAGAVGAYLVPLSLHIDVLSSPVRAYQPLTKDDLRVYAVSLLGKAYSVNDYTFADDRSEETYRITAQSGKLSGSIQGELLTGALHATYDSDVKEGDAFNADLLQVSFAYADGETIVPDTIKTDAPEYFTEDTTLHIDTDYGSSDVTVFVSPVSQIDCQYIAGTVYQGDAFEPSRIHADVNFADGETQEDIAFNVLGTYQYLNDKTSVDIATAYGRSSVEIVPVKVTGVTLPSGTVYHGGDQFVAQDVVLRYENGETKTVPEDEIGWDKKAKDWTLEEGSASIDFYWHQQSYTLTFNVLASNVATNAAKSLTDELAKADYTITTDSLYVAAYPQDNLCVTHIVMVDPKTQLNASYAAGVDYGFYESISDAYARTKWAVGVGMGDTIPAPSVAIRNGEIKQRGKSDGTEICIRSDGSLYTPPVGVSGKKLQDNGVVDTFSGSGTLLYQDGQAMDVSDDPFVGTVIAYTKSGEYYLIATYADSAASYKDVMRMLGDLDVLYAGVIANDGAADIAVQDQPLEGDGTALQMDYLLIR